MKIKKSNYPAPECEEIILISPEALLSGSNAGYTTEEFEVSPNSPWGEN